ncbi:MAG TPA: tRNA epoxyqueuosine(34) reductase QueG [Myxococcota bacterium]|nr:tRNA epoxyqueuosine(34) reductase QueG [Myxococcota bacterium]
MMTYEDLHKLAEQFEICELAAVAAGPTPVNRDDFRAAVASAPYDLGYLRRTLEKRLDPGLVMPGVKTVISGLVSYDVAPDRPSPLPDGTAWISRYAMGKDYHDIVGERFAALAREIGTRFGCRAMSWVDTGPLAEKQWAVAAGLGFQGKNTLLVSPRLGSFVFIGIILTDAVYTGAAPAPVPTGCNGCGACVAVCPTSALDADGHLDRARCLAHLTVNSKTELPVDVDQAGNLYGCDLCQDVCPFNRGPDRSSAIESDVSRVDVGPSSPFRPLPGLFCPSLDEILNMDREAFSRVFSGTPVLRRGLEGVQRSARRLSGRN